MQYYTYIDVCQYTFSFTLFRDNIISVFMGLYSVACQSRLHTELKIANRSVNKTLMLHCVFGRCCRRPFGNYAVHFEANF